MKRCLAIFLLLFCLIATLQAQKQLQTYPQLWRKVHKYELRGLPKSATSVVDSIYQKAKKEGNDPQLVKTLIYQSKFMLTLQEDAQLAIVRKFQQEISTAQLPAKNVLESVLANIYWQYYKENRWNYYQRSRTNEKVNPRDFRTWDLSTTFKEIHLHYQNSLEKEAELQKVNLKEFADILRENDGSKNYRPTLYDFLAHNALEFYKSGETEISNPVYKFEIDDALFFTDFEKVKLSSKDSLSLPLHALKIYQELLRFHMNDDDPTAYITADLDRLQFIEKNAILSTKDFLYLSALQNLAWEHQEHPVSATVKFFIAERYHEQASTYQPKKNQQYRFKNAEALEICNDFISRFPNSEGALKLSLLKENILRKKLALTVEKFLPVSSPSRLLVEYKNLDSLLLKIYRLSEEEQENFYQLKSDSAREAFMLSLQPYKEWQAPLRNELDYQVHSTELLMPELPEGNYLLLAGFSDPIINKEKDYAYSFFQVTNLALIQNRTSTMHHFQLINRLTGKPLEGAIIRMENDRKEGNGKGFDRSFVTDKDGKISFPLTDRHYEDIKAIVRYENEKAVFGSYHFYKNYHSGSKIKEEVRVKPFLFTDRSIYRPGQKVYFKGILIQRKGGKSEVVAREFVEVYLEDVNGQEIERLRLKTNDFGSFSGEFPLPVTGLTGEFVIGVEEDLEEDSEFYDEVMDDFEYEETYISVEEYKRPKFETQFREITETYRLQDTITVRGTAIAFSGSKISKAQVKYRVHRKVQYPHWYYWSRPSSYQSSSRQEITHGETTTNEQGEFSIDFKAIPNMGVSEDGMPVFHFELSADVTDVNGETRSATTTVKVGYHAMIATIVTPEKIDKSASEVILSVETKNLNRQAVPATGKVKIFKLEAPEYVLRERPWEAPDYQELPKAAFKKLFPHDPYNNEDKVEYRDKGNLVWEASFDTERSGEIKLPALEKWKSGRYIIELESKDAFGQKVVDHKRIFLYSLKDKGLADNELFSIQTDKTQYLPGDKVRLNIASAAENLWVTIQVEKEHQIIRNIVVPLNSNSKEIEIPVNKEDAGGFAIQYSFAAFNSFKSGVIPVKVEKEEDRIEIETFTFRDKIETGGEQNWSFRIKGDKKDKVAAEMLASMYDASLDQFKPHSWEFFPQRRRQYYSSRNTNAYHSFGTNQFSLQNYFPFYQHNQFQQRYDQLNWFGFSIANNNHVKFLYLQELAFTTYASTVKSKSDHKKKKGFVYGKVREDENDSPMSGVNIIVRGSSKGTLTDLEGNYSIEAKQGDELVFSFVGMQTIRIPVGTHNIINVALAPDIESLEELVVVGYGTPKKSNLTGAIASVEYEYEEEAVDRLFELEASVAGVSFDYTAENSASVLIRGTSSLGGGGTPLYIVDGIVVEQFELGQQEILSAEVMKGDEATALYGAKAANGVLIISTKEGQKKLYAEMAEVSTRQNFQETAFFYPHLNTDKKGNINFTFTVPEALSRWKLQLLAHTASLSTTSKTLYTVTQKDLMVTPNPPRFLRAGDEIVFSSKIANLTSGELSGNAALQLFDAGTGKPIDIALGNTSRNKPFTIAGKGNTQVSWSLNIPEDVETVGYKIVAKAGDFSDGEQNVLLVLPNRMLVTETLPLYARSNQQKTFSLDKLMNNTSTTLKHRQLTLEMTSNPAWYAIQALPYLMEFPHECAEQTFARYFANSLATHIVKSNPEIQKVFDQWAASGALESNLEKNETLKNLSIQETPWLRNAQNEAEQMKRIGLLFNLNKMSSEAQANLEKLKQIQLSGGGFPWFKGNHEPNRFITQHIAIGFGHLQHLGFAPDKTINPLIQRTIQFLDKTIVSDYHHLMEQAKKEKGIVASLQKRKQGEEEYLEKQHIGPLQVQYLYMISFFKEREISAEVKEASDYFLRQSGKYWKEQPLYLKGMIALLQHRNGNKEVSLDILESLEENSINSEEMGIYWKENKASWWWYQSPIETQTLMIEAFNEIEHPTKTAEEKRQTINGLKVWLLKNKQNMQWPTTKATTEAVYSLFLGGSDLLADTEMVELAVGPYSIKPSESNNIKTEAGTGYFKTSWKAEEIEPSMSQVTVSTKENEVVWGALYWQYFEDLDKISYAASPLQLDKKVFLVKDTDNGESLFSVAEEKLEVGDLLRVRIELKADREMEFVHMKDMRASALEPLNVLSEYKWQGGLGYYESTRDASTHFFFDRLPKGIYVFEYDARINNLGDFSNGITTIQSMYAPEFSSHSEGIRIKVTE